MKTKRIKLDDSTGLVRIETSDGKAFVLNIQNDTVRLSSANDSTKWMTHYISCFVGVKNTRVYGVGTFVLGDAVK